jgi:hypothetical protein
MPFRPGRVTAAPIWQQQLVEVDPLKVIGRFTTAEQENGKAAREAFKSLERPEG